MSDRIQVGTASWTDKSLIASKRFYPRGWNTAEARLKYYGGIERGEKNITLKTLHRIAEGLDTRMTDLLADID